MLSAGFELPANWGAFALQSNDTLNPMALFNNSQDTLRTLQQLQELRNLRRNMVAFREAADEIAAKFAIAFLLLGICAVVVNIAILSVILANRHRTTRQVFYVLVVSFTVIDVFRGLCLILYSVRMLKPEKLSPKLAMISMKIDQVALIVLRFCVLCNIFNLLLITLNEFIFIQFPLRYSRIVKVHHTVGLVVVSWIFSICFVLVATYTRNYAANIPSIYINTSANQSNEVYQKGDAVRIRQSSEGDEIEIQHIFNFILLGICFLCLFIVLVCYLKFFMVVRRFQKQEDELNKLHRVRRPSEVSIRSGSIDPSDPSDSKRYQTHVIRRYKHAIVIGSVIAVYMIFLVPYAAIQLTQFYMLRHQTKGKDYFEQEFRTKLVIRFTMHLLFGLHAILQPLCYFRMREFRKLFVKSCYGIIGCSKSGTSGTSFADSYIQADQATIFRRKSDASSLVVNPCPPQPNGILTKRTSFDKRYQQVSFADSPRPQPKLPQAVEVTIPIPLIDDILEQEGTPL